jgi:two-component system response regulator RegX3
VADIRILIVEDERSIAEPLAAHLGREGFDADLAPSVSDARAAMAAGVPPDLILLDVMLPDGDGRDLCREIRARSSVPIIMLTARGAEVDRIVGLELGADDYVVKPFSAGELVARIRAILRRRTAAPDRHVVEVGDIAVDLDARVVTKRGASVALTAREFDLLAMLARHAGSVVRREQIMDEVWDPHWFGSTKTLDVHVSWLRKKLEDAPAEPRYLRTVRGVGFRFAVPDDPVAAEDARGPGR